ncbi:IclR family transcriptional regulator domain-containing protein [Streptosporangium carneum]|uniref:Transcriptional regulator n=1 Tax=Streptosporangium carneum TaxID=47481 RepID=A0A9W6HW73_9ACTN|nr:IclR family transcriptional regulator C-terminal domain-containing protein [Streptosporangium carneum]GLK07457.1 transcriptional regulator [Streptosporangium carneum]
MERAGTLERGLAVLRALSADPGRRMRATDLTRATGLARSTVDRVVATLAHLGHLRVEDRDVLLAPPLLELGEAYLACCGLAEILGPHADRLARELDESVSLAVPDGDGVRLVGRFTRRRTMSVAFRTGELLPADRCAAGLALLDPAAPWAEDDQLMEPGLITVAMPVRDGSGRAVCALSVASHTSRHTVAGLRAHALPRLRKAVAEMETALSAPAPPSAPSAAVDASRAAKQELGAEYLQSLARGLAVLVSLGSARGGLPLAGAARVTGLPRATVRRAILSLERLGYAAAEGARFVLLPKVLELGYAHLSSRTLQEVIQPHLADLVARVRESASVAMLSGDEVVYVARVPVTSIMSVDITVGTRFPAYATSMGRVLLAGLPDDRLSAITPQPLTGHTVTSSAELAAAVRRARNDGYALVDQELEDGVRSVAVPLHDRNGRVVAALNVATHVSRATVDDLLRDVLPVLTETAARITNDLAHIRQDLVQA